VGKVIWSPAALDDIDAIAGYIARDSAYQAALFAARLVDAVERIAEFPHSGRMTPEIGDSHHREIIVGSYRVMYRVVNTDVWVTAIVHGARDWRA